MVETPSKSKRRQCVPATVTVTVKSGRAGDTSETGSLGTASTVVTEESVVTPAARSSDKSDKVGVGVGLQYFYSALELGVEAVLLARYARVEGPAAHRDYYRSLGTYLHADVRGRRKELRRIGAELERMRSGNAGTEGREGGRGGSGALDDGGSVEGQDAQRSLAEGEQNEEEGETGAAPGHDDHRPVPSVLVYDDDDRAGCLLPEAFTCGSGGPGRARERLLREIEGEEQALLRLDAVKERHATDPFVRQMATVKQYLLARRQRALLERYARGEDDAAQQDHYRSLGAALKGDVKSRRDELWRLRLRLEAVSAEWEDAEDGQSGSGGGKRRGRGSSDDDDSTRGEEGTAGTSWDGDDNSAAEQSFQDDEEGLQDAFQIFTRYTAEKFRAIRKGGRRELWRVVVE